VHRRRCRTTEQPRRGAGGVHLRRRVSPQRRRADTLGLTEKASFDVEEGAPDQLIPAAWFLTAIDEATEARTGELVRNATA
jgi:hypothetical protein